MNLSRRELYAAGEPLGDCATARKPCGGYLCGGGGRSSSSSAQTTYNTDKRLAVGDGGFGISADNSALSFSDSRTTNVTDARSTVVNALDGGAIAGAFDATKASVSRALQTVDLNNATNAEGFSKLLTTAEGLFNKGEYLIGQTQQAVADAYNQAQTSKAGTIDNRTIIVLAVAGAAAVFALRRKG